MLWQKNKDKEYGTFGSPEKSFLSFRYKQNTFFIKFVTRLGSKCSQFLFVESHVEIHWNDNVQTRVVNDIEPLKQLITWNGKYSQKSSYVFETLICTFFPDSSKLFIHSISNGISVDLQPFFRHSKSSWR